MSIHRAGGRSTATAATADLVAANLWNPSSAVPIWVREIHVASTTAGVSNLAINRSSARGTGPSSTVTPDIDNDVDKAIATPAGALLDLGTYSTTAPTLDKPAMERWNLPAVIGAGAIFVFGERGRGAIKVPPGAGLAVYTPVAVILPASDITYVWEE